MHCHIVSKHDVHKLKSDTLDEKGIFIKIPLQFNGTDSLHCVIVMFL